MVSIPDWARLKHLLGDQKNSPLFERYKKSQEADAIKKAESSGLFITLDEQYILDKLAEAVSTQKKPSILDKYGVQQKDLAKTTMISLPGSFIRSIKDIGLCMNLTICILSNNYISSVNPLMDCKQLVKLDLSNNQITLLPPGHYFQQLKDLLLLYLHGNPLAHLDNVHSIAGSQSLMGLTLLDTPLSLKKNYRHHVVNSIWTLKVLDHHLISDEEIIEDVHFTGMFTAQQKSFELNIHHVYTDRPTIKSELLDIEQLLKQINMMVKHLSPVVIIQRFVRGYLVRRKLMQFGMLPKFQAILGDGLKTPQPYQGQTPEESQIRIPSQKRPLSQPDSEFSARSFVSKSEIRGPVPSATTSARGGKKKIHINLAKLQQNTMKSLQDDREMMDDLCGYRIVLSPREVQHIHYGRKLRSSIMEDDTESDELPHVDYRLKGFKLEPVYIDPFVETLQLNQYLGAVVRHADLYYHHQKRNEPESYIPYTPPKNAFKKRMKVAKSTMNLAPLWAVHRAYNERERSEKKQALTNNALVAKEYRDMAKHRIDLYKNDRKGRAREERFNDHKVAVELIEKRQLARLQFLDRNQNVHDQKAKQMEKFQENQQFVAEFSKQNTSVSNALLRHDKNAIHEDSLYSKSTFVKAHKKNETEQSQIVEKFLAHRQLLRQTDATLSRAAIDTRMLQEANDRLMEAQTRVAQQKARSATVEQFYPLPAEKIHLLPPMPQEKMESMKGLNRYYTSVSMQEGRVGKHQTVIL